MAKKFGGRKYRKEKEKPARRDDDDDEDEDGEGERSSRRHGRKSSRRGKDSDSEFIHVTGMFESKKGGSWTVFVKEDMIEKLQDLEEDDLLGVSESKYGMSLWIRKADE